MSQARFGPDDGRSFNDVIRRVENLERLIRGNGERPFRRSAGVFLGATLGGVSDLFIGEGADGEAISLTVTVPADGAVIAAFRTNIGLGSASISGGLATIQAQLQLDSTGFTAPVDDFIEGDGVTWTGAVLKGTNAVESTAGTHVVSVHGFVPNVAATITGSIGFNFTRLAAWWLPLAGVV